MIGCSFVVDREYFGDIGLLDPGMEVYGGENIELGMRVSGAARGHWTRPENRGGAGRPMRCWFLAGGNQESA